MRHVRRHELLLWLAIVLIAMFVNEAVAGGECNRHDDCSTADIVVTADIEGDSITNNLDTGGSRTVALGNSLGDVDIAECLGSTQWSTPLFGRQKLNRDHTCVGFKFLAVGAYDVAAMHFCNDKDTLAEFDNEASCEAAHNFTPPEPSEPAVTQDDYPRHEQMRDDPYELLLSRIEELEQRPKPRLTPTMQQAPEPEPFITEQRRAELMALIEDDEDEDQ